MTAIALLAIVIFASWLRLDRLGGPSLWLDEILNVDMIRATPSHSPVEWLTGFERENGPLYYAVHGASLHAFESPEAGFRMPSAIAGVASVIAIFLAAFLATGSRVAGLVASALLAISPLHVYYSREGRPYSILVLLGLVALAALVGRDQRPRPIPLGIALLLMAETMATAIPFIAAVAVIATVDGIRSRERRIAALAPAITAALLVAWCALLYARFPQTLNPEGFRERFAGLGAKLLNSWTLTSQSVASIEPAALFGVALAVAGFLAMRDRRAAALTLGLATLPVLGTIFLLILSDHWFSIRYAILGLAPFLVLVAAGIEGVARILAKAVSARIPARRAGAVGVVLTALLVSILTTPLARAAVPAATTEPYARADWRRLANVLAAHARPDDVVLASSDWSAVSIGFYLREAHAPVAIHTIRGRGPRAVDAVPNRRAVWLVTGGWSDDGRLRSAACRSYCIARDPIESARVFFRPGLVEFLSRRADANERAGFVEGVLHARRNHLELGAGDSLFLADGWWGPENAGDETFRWCRRNATVMLPLPARDTRIEFRAAAFSGGDRPQRLAVDVDGTKIAHFELDPTQRTYTVTTGPRTEAGLVPVTFHFDWEVAPEDVSSSTDDRPLAASFEWIAVEPDGWAPPDRNRNEVEGGSPPVLFSVEGSIPRPMNLETATSCSGSLSWSSSELEIMAARLGIPDSLRVRLASRAGFARLVVDTLPPSECLSDTRFVDEVYPLLLSRRADRVGRTFYLAGLASGWSRDEVVCRLTTAPDFREP